MKMLECVIMLIWLMTPLCLIIFDNSVIKNAILSIIMIVLTAIILIASNNAEESKIQAIHQKIDEQGLDKTVIELYTGYDSIDDIEDYVDLPREEIIKILRTNNKLQNFSLPLIGEAFCFQVQQNSTFPNAHQYATITVS